MRGIKKSFVVVATLFAFSSSASADPGNGNGNFQGHGIENGNGNHYGQVPGPIAGAGLPVLMIGYLLYRSRRAKKARAATD